MRKVWTITIIIFITAWLVIIMTSSRCNYKMPTETGPYFVFHPEDNIPPDWVLEIVDTTNHPPDTIFINWDSLSSQ